MATLQLSPSLSMPGHQMYPQRIVRLRLAHGYRRQTLPCIGSSSTPTAPYSTADILYNNEVGLSQKEDQRQSSFTDSEKNREPASQQKSKEIDSPDNRRPSSKSGSKKSLSIETVSFEKEDSLKSSTLPPPKGANHFRPNGIRNNVLKGEPLFSTRSSMAVSSSGEVVYLPTSYLPDKLTNEKQNLMSERPYIKDTRKLLETVSMQLQRGREADDLIAMGSLWSPNQTSISLLSHHQSQSQSALHPGTQPPHHQRSSYTNTMSAGLVNISNSLSSKSLSLNTNSMQPPISTASASMTLQRKFPSNGIKPIMVQNNLSGLRSIKEKKEEDAKYSDPLAGATPQFLQRVQELQALEGETIRWERTKKLKKKKQDRDS
ncbi:hypothetical protein CHS0354_036689 [Potamilus streckersoni]|uniref:Uncharacterized protein n=1 Tax=Potamilus streckersoni TaxID=2493646 RepID=A0AAE0TGF3_9BIVA|nr:hypothetical protein CHS0354_036689 [Potamilus streckersoni]